VVDTQHIKSEDRETYRLCFPIINDSDRKIALLYGMLDKPDDTTILPLTVRNVYIIGPDKIVKAIFSYPSSTGRNFDEIVRVLDALQLNAQWKVFTPANWKHGEECIIPPSFDDKQAKNIFSGGLKIINNYIRLTPQPNVSNSNCTIL